jgi:predicted MarR family transcription regulator
VFPIITDQYVKLNILDFYLEDDKKIVTDVALINVIEDSKLATKELLKSKGDTIVYHTGSEKIVIEMRTPTGLRGMRL